MRSLLHNIYQSIPPKVATLVCFKFHLNLEMTPPKCSVITFQASGVMSLQASASVLTVQANGGTSRLSSGIIVQDSGTAFTADGLPFS